MLDFSTSSLYQIRKDTVAMLIFVLTTPLRARLATETYACQLSKGERWQPGTARHRDALFPPILGHTASQSEANKTASMREQERGSHRPDTTLLPPSPHKEWANLYHLPGKGRHSFCSAAHPCCRSSDAHARRPRQCCEWSLLTLLLWPELCAKVFKVEQARKSHPLSPLLPQLPPLDTVPKGRSPYTPLTHPSLAHGQATPRWLASASHTQAHSSSPAYCFYLCPTWMNSMFWINSLSSPDQHQPLFSFLHVNTSSSLQPHPCPFPLSCAYSVSGGFPIGAHYTWPEIKCSPESALWMPGTGTGLLHHSAAAGGFVLS